MINEHSHDKITDFFCPTLDFALNRNRIEEEDLDDVFPVEHDNSSSSQHHVSSFKEQMRLDGKKRLSKAISKPSSTSDCNQIEGNISAQ